MHQQIQDLWKLIENSQKILLTNHIRMDGDAWGSLWGFALILKSMGKTVKAINDDPVPESFAFLWNTGLINPNLNVADFNPDIIISLDASDTERLWDVYLRWKNTFDEKPFIVIDHHVSNPWFWELNIIDAEASSVCEILTHIIVELSWEEYVSPEAATFLYTGLQTDSNLYFNSNTRSSTLRAWATLMDLWANFRLPIYEFYKKRTVNQIKLWLHAFTKTEYHKAWKICSCVLEYQELQALNIPKEEFSWYLKGLISEILINIEWVKIAFLIYPLSETENKVSMRSLPWCNVAETCESFWGGGHVNAAGFQSEKETSGITEQLLTTFRNI